MEEDAWLRTDDPATAGLGTRGTHLRPAYTSPLVERACAQICMFDHCIAARAEELKSEETAALAPLVPPKARTLSGTSGTKSSLDRCYEGVSMGC